MQPSDIQRLQQEIDAGRLTRRLAVQRLVAAGLGLPMVYGLLGPAAPAHAQAGNPPAYPGTRRGGGGLLRCLYWQAPTALNPHFATGTKDADAARLFYEGLARWDDEGDLHPPLRQHRRVALAARLVLHARQQRAVGRPRLHPQRERDPCDAEQLRPHGEGGGGHHERA